jgi:hypothetical protein
MLHTFLPTKASKFIEVLMLRETYDYECTSPATEVLVLRETYDYECTVQ